MPRLEHERWCDIHDDDSDGGPGRCNVTLDFGPRVDHDGWHSTVGGLGLSRYGDDAIGVYIDYRTTGGEMDVMALRSVREAVAASPEEFLEALDRVIAVLGSDCPKAYEVRTIAS